MAKAVLPFTREGGRVYVICPICGTRQVLPLDKDWYDVDAGGKVFPDFVCMNEGRTCLYAATITLINW